ncbi:MAG: glutamine-hydrolyzing GMP synthase [Deltaproteobacteria bacterium]|nr:glutamine-hydrolyzing GMP synthase [Deltaproteobacteria bacterium]MBI3294588.1 glutamine-hydrolyzing GMP synthase [Deltaproteobacteria bacterium]
MTDSPVIILDFGSQFTQLIARSVRELGVYCEIEPYSIRPEKLLGRNPRALILSGGPASVYAGNSPQLKSTVFDSGLPVMGICYGMQLLSHIKKGRVASANSREYGHSEMEILKNDGLFDGFSVGEKQPVWMSHGDSVVDAPEGAVITARSTRCPVVGYQLGTFYGVQFHPEVAHTQIGSRLFSNFLFKIAGLKPNWKVEDVLETKAREIRAQVRECNVIGGVSGGVDSSVLALFLSRVLGKQFHPILVDNGLLRHEEAKQVKAELTAQGVNLKVVDASKLFLGRLAKTTNPETKRKIIGKTFIEVFEKECRRIKNAKFLAQGTLYPDVIESVSVKGPSHTIKTHHNVGGLPKRLKLGLVEPFRELFKDEVRVLGRQLGLSQELSQRHPFPGPGLAVRILGRVTPDRLKVLRQADVIFTEELRRQKLYNEIWQAFTVLLPVQSVGVMGDARTYESVLALRAVTSRDGMTADWYGFSKEALSIISNRIVNEVRGVNRVVYDVSSKPPATIEWE